MSKELLFIRMQSGIVCKDGRHFLELICNDKDDKDVRILLPSSEECEQEVCDRCSKYDTCEIMCPREIELGKYVAIIRPD